MKFGGVPMDYKLNQRHSAYFRFFRDQGTNDQPDGVTGGTLLSATCRRMPCSRCNRFCGRLCSNEFKIGYNSALSRLTARSDG